MDIKLSEPYRIYYEPFIYSSFPDVAIGLDGKYVCVFRTGDNHHPIDSALMMSTSSDGQNWETEVFATANLSDIGYVFNCPKITNLNNRLCVVCDTKTSTQEAKSDWGMLAWWNFGKKWSKPQSMSIEGIVPDNIIRLKKSLVMGYHVCDKTDMVATQDMPRKYFAQMMAESLDDGNTWRDRKTIAISDKHSFCEGSIVAIDDQRMLCFLRDNKGQNLRSHVVISVDGGRTWTKSMPLPFSGHRIVAGVKQHEPYKGAIIGTFRNVTNKTLSMFIQNISTNKIQVLPIDTETNFNVFNYGYSGWVENEDGSLQVVYYIQRNNPQPEIVSMKVSLY